MPGGVDMFLFSMVKHELIKPEVEKVRALGAVRSVARGDATCAFAYL